MNNIEEDVSKGVEISKALEDVIYKYKDHPELVVYALIGQIATITDRFFQGNGRRFVEYKMACAFDHLENDDEDSEKMATGEDSEKMESK